MTEYFTVDRTQIFITILVSIGLLAGYGAYSLTGIVLLSNLATIFTALVITFYEFERK